VSCIVLLLNHQPAVLKTSLVGGILVNILFYFGIGLICGGIHRDHQNLNRTAAHMSSNMLSLASTSILIPTASRLLSQATPDDLVKQSRGASVILIVAYVLYVYCEQWTHRNVYQKQPEPVMSRTPHIYSVPKALRDVSETLTCNLGSVPGDVRTTLVSQTLKDLRIDSVKPRLHMAVASLLFTTSTVLLYFNTDFAVQSIDALTEEARLSKTFVGLILFPLSNCDYIPIVLAKKDLMGDAVSITVGKSIQTALLVTPLIVIIAWGVGIDEVTLVFDGFEVVSLFSTVLLLNFLIVDAKVHW
jgi:Ca2+:H+ antiporter